MWMSQAVGGATESSSISSQPYGSSFTSGSGQTRGRSDSWKSKVLENGQWIGEKVLEYGVRLTRGSHTSIPDVPKNDGRANWMAEMKSSRGTDHYDKPGGFNSSVPVGGYQNEFNTVRPSTYSDYKFTPTGKIDVSTAADRLAFGMSSNKSEFKKSAAAKKKKSKKSKRTKKKKEVLSSDASEPESSEESEEEVVVKSERKRSTRKKSRRQESEEETSEASVATSTSESEEKAVRVSKREKVKKSSSGFNKYEYSLNLASIPAPPPHDTDNKENETHTEEDLPERVCKKKDKKKSKSCNNKKAEEQAEVVDLLGLDAWGPTLQVIEKTTVETPSDEQSVASMDHRSTIDQLAGLSFENCIVEIPPPVNDVTEDNAIAVGKMKKKEEPVGLQVPGSNLVDLSSLSCKGKPKSTKTLNELQQLQGSKQQTPAMMISPESSSSCQQLIPVVGGMYLQPMLMQTGLLHHSGGVVLSQNMPNVAMQQQQQQQQQQHQQQQTSYGMHVPPPQ